MGIKINWIEGKVDELIVCMDVEGVNSLVDVFFIVDIV